MIIEFLDKRCQDCGTRLTVYEMNEKAGRCMECAKEQEPKKAEAKFSLLDWKRKKIVNQ